MPSDAERRLKELEEQVRSERASGSLRESESLIRARQAAANATAAANRFEVPANKPAKKSKLSWKTKLLLAGGAVLAGAVVLWVTWKIVKIAFYLGLAAAVAFGVWYVFFRKKKPA